MKKYGTDNGELKGIKPMPKKNGAESVGRPAPKPKMQTPAAKKGTLRDKLNTTDELVQRERNAKAKADAAKPNKVEKLIQDVTNRYRVTAREARDIVTAAGTVAKTVGKIPGSVKAPLSTKPSSEAKKNLVNQVKETAVAAATGKKGTTSDKTAKMGSVNPNAMFPKDTAYVKGKKR